MRTHTEPNVLNRFELVWDGKNLGHSERAGGQHDQQRRFSQLSLRSRLGRKEMEFPAHDNFNGRWPQARPHPNRRAKTGFSFQPNADGSILLVPVQKQERTELFPPGNLLKFSPASSDTNETTAMRRYCLAASRRLVHALTPLSQVRLGSHFGPRKSRARTTFNDIEIGKMLHNSHLFW